MSRFAFSLPWSASEKCAAWVSFLLRPASEGSLLRLLHVWVFLRAHEAAVLLALVLVRAPGLGRRVLSPGFLSEVGPPPAPSQGPGRAGL